MSIKNKRKNIINRIIIVLPYYFVRGIMLFIFSVSFKLIDL